MREPGEPRSRSPNCLFFTADDNQNTIQWDYSHSSNISNATHFLPLHLPSSDHTFTRCRVTGPGLLSKIRKLPHSGGLAMFFFNQLVTPCPPVWRWWRWWENILYSSQLVCLLYLYISMWSPLWEHHICSPSAQHYHSSPSSCLCLFALFLASQQR